MSRRSLLIVLITALVAVLLLWILPILYLGSDLGI